MRRIYPWFPWFPKDFLSSPRVQALEAHEVGAYILMLSSAWLGDPQCYLPDDEELLRRICRLSREQWALSSALILSFWEHEDGKIYNRRQLECWRKLYHTSSAKSDAGKRGAEVRWQSHESAIATAMANDSYTETETETETSSLTSSIANDSGPTTASLDTRLRAHNGACGDTQPPRDPEVINAQNSPQTASDAIERDAMEEEIVAEWNRLPAGFPRVKALPTRGRVQKALRRRLKDRRWRETWRQAMAHLATLPGMRAGAGFSFRATLRWFCQEESVAMLLDGDCDSWFTNGNTPRRQSEFNEAGKWAGHPGA